MNRRSNLFVYSIITLGVIGILYTLFTQPSRLLVQLGSIVFFGAIIFLIYKIYMRRRLGGSGNDYSAYRRAAKQSKRRFNEQTQQKPVSKVVEGKKLSSSPKKASPLQSGKRKKSSPSHLTVIEGKKGKKKNRAFF
ncbi:SA1362 family protein [Litchfieldia alkalitelluris]|uniref:SA1362 family protein n=1 Tax=Litchfieldia alkalitelluris TaxID=304268 RepID=UPI000998C49A|nr:SA1362 family protein [Litchfieldia alkalitelluris]